MAHLAVRMHPLIDELTTRCGRALAAAGLDESLVDLCVRLQRGRMITIGASTCDGLPELTLSPFVELLLRDAIAAAEHQSLDAATKTSRIAEALRLGGF